MRSRVRVIRVAIGASALLAAASLAAVAQTSWNDPSLGVSSSTATKSTGDCWAPVQQHLAAAEQQSIANGSMLASQNFQFLPHGQTFSQASCLSNLLSGSLDTLFTPPNLSGIVSAVVSKACSIATNYEQQAIAPVARGLQQGLPSYEIAPGISTGAISGGMYISPSVGGGSAGPVSVNVTPMLGGQGENFTSQTYFNGLLGKQ
ncbi:hypothetical protein [Acidiphilium sp. C61]|uniref:hypothetical protein n=1 Tax=Acidiphilium sp. C61 TaxID=1671485 RepID=UPI00157B5077|nr:hypothetical protein [Acidiphilium sp. C61]